MTSSLRSTPARANVDAAGGSAPPARVCKCGAPATHRVNAAGWMYVSGRYPNTLCQDCALVVSRERATANLAAALRPTDDADPFAIFDAAPATVQR